MKYKHVTDMPDDFRREYLNKLMDATRAVVPSGDEVTILIWSAGTVHYVSSCQAHGTIEGMKQLSTDILVTALEMDKKRRSQCPPTTPDPT